MFNAIPRNNWLNDILIALFILIFIDPFDENNHN